MSKMELFNKGDITLEELNRFEKIRFRISKFIEQNFLNSDEELTSFCFIDDRVYYDYEEWYSGDTYYYESNFPISFLLAKNEEEMEKAKLEEKKFQEELKQKELEKELERARLKKEKEAQEQRERELKELERLKAKYENV